MNSSNKRFANFQNIVFIENLSIKKAESDKISKDENVGKSGQTKVPLLYFSIRRDS